MKVARGTYRRDRSNPNEPEVEVLTEAAPPSDLAPDEVEAWHRVWAAVSSLRCVAASDLEMVRMCAQAMALNDRTRRDPKASVNQKLRAASHLRTMMVELGMSPIARGRVSALSERNPQDDKLAGFMSYPGKPTLVKK
ncbi:MAG: hypothetical protein WB493_00415 [Anaeromyxobacteraceae bacterium]